MIVNRFVRMIHEKAKIWINDEIDFSEKNFRFFSIAFNRLRIWWFNAKRIARCISLIWNFFFDWFRWNHFVWSHRCYFDWFDLNRLKSNFFRCHRTRIQFDKMFWLKWFWISLICFEIQWLLIFFSFLTNCMIFVMCLCDLQRFFKTSKLMNSTKNRVSRSLKICCVCWKHRLFDAKRWNV